MKMHAISGSILSALHAYDFVGKTTKLNLFIRGRNKGMKRPNAKSNVIWLVINSGVNW